MQLGATFMFGAGSGNRFLRIAVLAATVSLDATTGRCEELREGTLSRIAFGSCALQDRDQPIWDAIVASQPELFVFLGDNIYADTEDMQVMQAKYDALAAKPGFQRLLAACPVLATWDDHDYGVDNGGAWYPRKEESAKLMLDFFGVPKDSPRRKRDGVYGAYRFGPEGRRVQIILLDTRYFKSPMVPDDRSPEEKKRLNIVGGFIPNDDPEATLLGEEQWAWLEKQLLLPAELRIIASSIQVVADEKGMESWGNFSLERQRLYQLIESTHAEGVVFISGDVHFSEISRTSDGPYPLYDFTSSSLTHSHAEWAQAVNNFRVDDLVYAESTFGVIRIDWSKPSPEITFSAHHVNGSEAFSMPVLLDSLK